MGLLALPRGVAPRRLVSFQHGTSTTRTAVPSQLDGTGIATAIVFAGNGYALIAPDYPGMGESPGRHPYYIADSIGPAVADMIAASQRVKGVPSTPAFLAGFSEGGWASLAALRVLESRGQQVLGSAQVAGAYDIRRVSLPAALKGGAPSHSLYLAYAAWGQAAYYGHSLDSVLTPEYAATVERLFAGAGPKEILSTLPQDPRSMFNASFLDALIAMGLTGISIHSPRTASSTSRPARLFGSTTDRRIWTSCRRKRWPLRARCARGMLTLRRSTSEPWAMTPRCWPRRR